MRFATFVRLHTISKANQQAEVILPAEACLFAEVTNEVEVLIGRNPASPPARAKTVVSCPQGQFFVTETIDEIWGLINPEGKVH